MIKSSFWKVPPFYLFQLSSLWLFSIEGAVTDNHKPEFCHVRWNCLLVKFPCCISRQYLMPWGESFHLETFGSRSSHCIPHKHCIWGIADTAGWSTAVFNTHNLKAAEYFQAWADVHACGTRCRTGELESTSRNCHLEEIGLDCTQPEKSLGWKGPMEMVWTNLLL